MDDDLSGVLPGRRFITIHPDLLDIMGYHEAALIHEIRWRAVADSDEWVTLSPAEWVSVLHLTAKRVRMAVDTCVAAGWIEGEKQGRAQWNHTRSFRLCTGAIRSALLGRSLSPGGQISSALEGESSYLQEPLQEVPGASLPLVEQTIEDTSSSTPPPVDPPEGMFQDGVLVGTSITERQWNSESDSWRRGILQSLGMKLPALPPKAPRADAPSVPEDPARLNVIRRPEGLARALSRGYGFEASSQADHRNIAKLLDLKPTISQLDGAIEAMGWVKGTPLDLGRLVTKWGTFSQFGSKRPTGWKNERTDAKDAVERHEAAGGNKYDLDKAVDYGV